MYLVYCNVFTVYPNNWDTLIAYLYILVLKSEELLRRRTVFGDNSGIIFLIPS